MQKSVRNGLKGLIFFIPLIILFIAAFQRGILWQDGVEMWQDVVKKSPKKMRAHNNLGVSYSRKGLLTLAIQELYKAIELSHDYWISHFNLGKVFWKAGYLDPAVKEFLEALRLNPYSHDIHMRLGEVYEAKGLYNKALFEYQLALIIKPDSEEIEDRYNKLLEKMQLKSGD